MASQDSDIQDRTDDRDGGPQGEASTGVGAMLMATRLRIGEELRNVAKTLHIRFIYLQAIEDGRYDDLPGAAYALGFIRSYAEYLGLDSAEVVRRFKKETSTENSESSELVFPVPIPESSVPGGAIVFIGFVVAILAYGGWYVSTAKDGFLAELVSPLPERLNALLPEDEKTESAPEPAPDSAEETGETTASPESAPSVPEQPAVQANETETETAPEVAVDVAAEEIAPEAVAKPVDQVAETVEKSTEPVEAVVETVTAATGVTHVDQPKPAAPVAETVQQPPAKLVEPAVDFTRPEPKPAPEPKPVAAVTETATAVKKPEPVQVPAVTATPAPQPEVTQSAAEPQGRVYGVDDDQFRIEVKALKNSWIQVRDDTANKLILTRLLRVGDSYRVPDRKGLKLLTGNAGALKIIVDGDPVPPIGGSGAVRRSVALDPDRLKQGQAVE